MITKSKSKFLEGWESYVDDFALLGFSTSNQELWEEIKRLREEMRKVVHKVADELEQENYFEKEYTEEIS